MTRSTASRRARNSDSVMIGGLRRPDSRPSRRRCRLASSRVEPLTPLTSEPSSPDAPGASARARRCSAGRRTPGPRRRRSGRCGACAGAAWHRSPGPRQLPRPRQLRRRLSRTHRRLLRRLRACPRPSAGCVSGLLGRVPRALRPSCRGRRGACAWLEEPPAAASSSCSPAPEGRSSPGALRVRRRRRRLLACARAEDVMSGGWKITSGGWNAAAGAVWAGCGVCGTGGT